MAAKCTFNPTTKIITITQAPVDNIVEIDVKVDLYSDGKEDWKTDASLTKFRFPIRAVGGDPLPGSKKLGSTFFLQYGWKIRPYETSHTMNVNGNLYSEDGTSPYISTVGTYNIAIVSSVSSLVDSTVQQLPEIEHASFNGGITVDSVNGIDSGVFPAGTPQAPVQTCSQVMELAEYRGFKKIYFINDFSIENHSMSGYSVYGLSPRQTTLTIGTNLLWGGGTISDCKVEGTFANNSFVTIEDAEVGNLNNISLTAKNCILSGTVELNNSISSNFYNCTDGVPGSGTPIIQVNDCDSLGIWNYAGGIKLTNMTTVGTTVSFNAPSGRLIVDSTDTQGSIIARGVGSITGTTGGTTVTQTDLINRDTISDSVWDESSADHTLSTSLAKDLQTAKARSTLAFINSL